VFDQITFQRVEGKKNKHHITFLGLSTCGFCKRGIAFLNENGFEYEYIYVDKIDPKTKKAIVEEFRDKFDTRLHYPTIIIDDEHYEMGFVRPAWEKRLEV
jgi:glutaredoxin